MLRELFIRASVGLFIAFAIWKIVTASLGLSYRYKWVLTTDIIALSAVVGSMLYVHFAWRLLIRPGTEQVFLAGVVVYAIVLVVCSLKARAVDKANGVKRRVQEPDRIGDAGNDGDVS